MAFLDKWALAPVVRYNDWTQDELDKLHTGVAQGLSDTQLALRIGRSMRAVRRMRVLAIGVRYRNVGPCGEWTEERVAQLKALAAEGWSNGQIALKMGFSRNAVIGKRDRLKLPKPETKANFDKCLPPRPRRQPRAVRAVLPKAKVLPIAVVEPLRVGFMDLRREHCRWVLEETGYDGLALYCGHEKLGPHSYCPGHWRIATNRSKDNRFELKQHRTGIRLRIEGLRTK